tara:strand:- start:2960 stop:3352 length:393 start_codon:yes stop_codon:yes gene_type:complete
VKTAFVNGCFDILHIGHLRLLEYARSTADKLIVALDSDERVKQSKGFDRPFNTLADRKEMLLGFTCVDEVRDFSNDNELKELVRSIHPSTMIVGGDWRGKDVIGGEYADELKFFDRIGQHSTTRILRNVK